MPATCFLSYWIEWGWPLDSADPGGRETARLACPPVRPTLSFMTMIRFAPMLALVLLPAALRANDSAAELGAGGLRLRAERRVAMVSEELFISKRQVRVDYAFVNVTRRAVRTEVAFPAPESVLGPYYMDYSVRAVADFSLEVDGRPQPFRTRARAWARGRDVTALLKAAGVDIASFAGIRGSPTTGVVRSQLDRLPRGSLRRLRRAGLLKREEGRDIPDWGVRITYHWTQTFPVGRTLRVSHAYTPVAGYQWVAGPAELEAPGPRPWNHGLGPLCLAPLRGWLDAAIAARPQDPAEAPAPLAVSWVRYILITARSWRPPIRDFQLEVAGEAGEGVAFCWDGPLQVLAPGHVRASARDFVPGRDLVICFVRP